MSADPRTTPATDGLGSQALRSYAFAVAVFVIALTLRRLLDPVWGANLPFITFYPAVVLAAYNGGFVPGVLTTALSAAASAFFWFQPTRSFVTDEWANVLAVAVFVTVGLVISALSEALHRMRRVSEAGLEDRLRLAAIVRDSDDAIVAKTLQGIITSWNPAAERLFGYTPAEAIGRSITIIIPPERLAEEDEVLRRLARGERIDHFETVRVTKTGERLDTSLTVSPIKDADGRIVGASKIARDVSERKRRERERTELLAREHAAREQAERAERRAQFLSEASSALGSSLDYETTLASVARRAVPLLADWAAVDLKTAEGGIHRVAVAHADPAKEAWARSLEERYALDPEARHGVPNVIRTGRPEFHPRFPTWWIAKAAKSEEDRLRFEQEPLCSAIIVPLVARGETLGALTFITGDSARSYSVDDLRLAEEIGRRAGLAVDNAQLYRETEAARRRSTFLAEMSAALASSLDYELTLDRIVHLAVPALADICALDLITEEGDVHRMAAAHVDAAQEGAILSLRDRFGFNADARHGVPAVLRSGVSSLVTDVSDAHLREAATSDEQLAVLREMRMTAWMIVPLIARGRVLGALTFASLRAERRYGAADLGLAEAVASRAASAIDNARLYREATAARAEAEASSRTKDEFLATLSHELRTPLTSVFGWARMLQDADLGRERSAKAVNAIVRNTKVQLQLIDDLLDVSRIISGKMRLDVRRVDLAKVVEDVVETVRPAAEAKSLHLQTILDPRADVVTGDANRLQQVVWNLAMNAVKFTPKGGDIRIELTREESQVAIVVSDTGEGIPADALPHIFGRFQQADSSRTRPHGGLGLGLAIVRHLVELHGGTVDAKSPGPGRGATFTVRLPTAAAETAPERAVAPAAPEGTEAPPGTALSDVSILVVDDDPDTLDMLAAILRRAGADVRTAVSAAEALQVFHQRRPDLVVSDIEMPAEDGYDLVRRLRALPRGLGGDVPAVALTAYGRTADRVRSLSAGFNTHLSKPVDPAEFVAVLASLVSLHKTRRRAS